MQTAAEAAAEKAEIEAAANSLEIIPGDGPAPVVQAAPVRVVQPPTEKVVEVVPPAPKIGPPPVVPPVETAPALSEIDQLAQDRLAALARKRAPVRTAPITVEHPEATTPPPKPPPPPTDPLDMKYLFEEAKRRGVDPRQFVLDALEVVQGKKEAPKYELPVVLSEIDALKKQAAEERAAREKLEKDIGVAGSEWAEQQRAEAEAQADAQILAAAGKAFVGDQPETVKARELYPRAAKQKPGWVAQYVLGAVKAGILINEQRGTKGLAPLRLTTETIFASMENELKDLGVEPSSTVAPAVAVPKPAERAAPKSPEASPGSTTTQGSFAVPRGLEGLRLRPGEHVADLDDQARAAALLEVVPSGTF